MLGNNDYQGSAAMRYESIVCCRVLQGVAACCSVLQSVTECCVLQRVAESHERQ